jgi:tRNA threonylcarbamoyladenosine biosynthesis protein TsaE
LPHDPEKLCLLSFKSRSLILFLHVQQPVLDIGFTLKDLTAVARGLLAIAKARIFLFDAPMGAGKTTLIKEMCSLLGSEDNFSSPTFSIVNEYAYGEGKIYHLDLYRVKNVEELFDIGIEEYLDSGNYCFIEWPALAENLVESEYVKVDIEVNIDHRRLRAYMMEE